MSVRRQIASGMLLACVFASPGAPLAAAPVLLRTSHYESPVRGGAGDLLSLGGSGFRATDRVVYAARDLTSAGGGHPAAVPMTNTAQSGTASIVQHPMPAYSIVVQLPMVIAPATAYRLWVVDAEGEWSEPVAINEPRPLWISPARAYSSADPAGLGRVVRIVGRNLGQRTPLAGASWIRLRGPGSYDLAVPVTGSDEDQHLGAFVRKGTLPSRMIPGQYSVSISDDGRNWSKIEDQALQIQPDPRPLPHFAVSDTRFGHCQPDSGLDASDCLARALEVARQSGGAVITFASGTWDLNSNRSRDGFIVAPNVHLEGAVHGVTTIRRHGARLAPIPGALLTLTRQDSVSGLSFTDDEHYESAAESRSIIQLGRAPAAAESDGVAAQLPDDVVVSRDTFLHVGRALTSSGRAIHRLSVTHNVFGAFDTALMLTGGGADPAHPFDLADSIFRDNRFVPGSYLDVAASQGTIASQIGASHRVDFSGNTADGAATEGLQTPDSPRGWRAAFFWSLANNNEELLVSDNRIDCSGDKAGDGEAIALDNSGGALAFDGAQPVSGAGADWVSVAAVPPRSRDGKPFPAAFLIGQWITVVDGAGLGQSRKIRGFVADEVNRTVRFRVAPRWDVVPRADQSRVTVMRQYWQVYIVANRINHASPPCRKSNRTGPHGGAISLWTSIADSVVEGNAQDETDGIGFLQAYSTHVPSCPNCASAAVVTALEIRGNRISGEYDWSSDCSWSGIRGYFVAAPTPQSPPPWLGMSIVIAGNEVSHADGVRGGAIEIARAGASGPSPGKWPMSQNVLIYQNIIRDIGGAVPRNLCRQQQTARAGIRIEGDENIRNTVLQGNRCDHVDVALQDSGTATTRICPITDAGSCECREH